MERKGCARRKAEKPAALGKHFLSARPFLPTPSCQPGSAQESAGAHSRLRPRAVLVVYEDYWLQR